MDNSILKQATDFLHEQKNHKRWHTVLICLAVLVILGTVAVLMMPGQAQNHTKQVLECTLEVHEHTKECYSAEAWELLEAGKLTKEELTAQDLICGLADYVVHTHNDDCYENGDPETGKLVCTLPEIEAHKHTEACFVTERRLICGLEETGEVQEVQTPQVTETAPEEDSAAQTPDSESPEPEDSTVPEEIDEQPVSGGDLVGQIPQQPVPASGGTPEIIEPHVHTDACYEEVRIPVCGKWELHMHDAACYDEEGHLICGLLELKEHIHGEACIKTVELSEEEVALLNQQDKSEETASEESTEEVVETEPAETEAAETEPAETEAGEDTEEEPDISGNDAASAEVPDVSGGDEGTLTAKFTDGKVKITAVYGPEADIPEGAELFAYEVTPGSKRYEQRRQEALDVLGGAGTGESEEGAETGNGADETSTETKPVTEDDYQLVVYNIGFYLDGVEVEPKAPVNITIQFLDADGMVINEGVTILHFAETEEGETAEIEVLDGTAETEENSVNFNVGGFSDFAMALGETGSLGQTFRGTGKTAAFWYTMAGIGLVLVTSFQYKRKFGERRSETSRN